MLRSTLAAVGLSALVATILFAQSPGRPSAPAGDETTRASQGPAARGDVLSQLLAEVRGLRQVLRRQGADSARIQLLTNRLTLQETRVSRLTRDLEQVREELARLPEEQRQWGEQLKQFEATVPLIADAAERKPMENQITMMQRRERDFQVREQRLRARETELDSAYGAEQARWMEISNRLDDLERSLERP